MSDYDCIYANRAAAVQDMVLAAVAVAILEVAGEKAAATRAFRTLSFQIGLRIAEAFEEMHQEMHREGGTNA